MQGRLPYRCLSHGSSSCSTKHRVSWACSPTSSSLDTASSCHGMRACAQASVSNVASAKPWFVPCRISSASRAKPSFFSSCRAEGCISRNSGCSVSNIFTDVEAMLSSFIAILFEIYSKYRRNNKKPQQPDERMLRSLYSWFTLMVYCMSYTTCMSCLPRASASSMVAASLYTRMIGSVFDLRR